MYSAWWPGSTDMRNALRITRPCISFSRSSSPSLDTRNISLIRMQDDAYRFLDDRRDERRRLQIVIGSPDRKQRSRKPCRVGEQNAAAVAWPQRSQSPVGA